MSIKQVRTIVVDDESRIRRGIERLVKACSDDFEIVGSYSSGIECLNHFHQEEFEFDLLITDIKMPGMDGLKLIKELKNFVSFEAVVISGFNDFKYLQSAIREGAVDYLVKPIIRDEFRLQLNRVKEKIQQKRAEEERFEEMDAELSYVKQCQLLSELIRGMERDLSELDWTRDFPQRNYFLFNISKDNGAANKQNYIPENVSVETVLSDILKEKYRNTNDSYWLWKGDDSSFWVLINTEGNGEDWAYTLAESLQSHLKSKFHQPNSIAVSDMFQDLTLLPSVRDNLLSLLQFRLTYGGNQVFSFSSIEKNNIKKNKVKDSKGFEIIINKILKSLERFQMDGDTPELLRQFFKKLEQLESPKLIEQNVQLLSVQIVNYLLKQSQTKDEILLIHEALLLTKKASNFTVLKEHVLAWMQGVFKRLQQVKRMELTDPVLTAKQWILDNLGENITIEKIAREIPMNPTYFCEYFKTQTGETVLDYVTRTRIEHAKEYLLTTDLKIYDIAKKVGYSDTKYFSKLFKRYFGEVPSKFKENLKYS